jgi:transposase
MRHRARELLAGQRTAALNALRGHLAEIGLIAPQGAHHAYGLKRMAVDGFNENGEIVVPDCVRGALRSLAGQIDALDEAIGAIDRELAASVKADETSKRLMTIPGVGPVTASAIRATIQDASAFGLVDDKMAMLKRLARVGKRAVAHSGEGVECLRREQLQRRFDNERLSAR